MSTTQHPEEMMAESELKSAQTPEQRFAALEERMCDLEAENDRLRERVNELENELDDRAAVRWDSTAPADIMLDGEHGFPLGKVLTSKAASSEVEELEKDVDSLLTDVHDLKIDGVDAADLVGAGDDGDIQLPIEDTVSALRSDVRDDPSANKQRATVLFRAFGGRARKTKGGKLQLDSAAARAILQEKAGLEDVNRNTNKRAMKQTAKLTSTKPEKDRRADDEDNLITMHKGGEGRLVLRADAEEWRRYLSEVSDRYK